MDKILLKISFVMFFSVFVACLIIFILSFLKGENYGGWVIATVAMFKIVIDFDFGETEEIK